MWVTVKIESITFEDSFKREKAGDPEPDRFADVVVAVTGIGSEPFKLHFPNRRFESLDGLAEEVRLEVRRFAGELVKAAELPLR